MENTESTISRIKELSKIIDDCINQPHACENCPLLEDEFFNIVCEKPIRDLLKEIDRL